MDNTKPKKKTVLLILFIIIAIILVATPVTYAIFTNSMNAQRTIAAYETTGERFSSNYLARGFNKDNVSTIAVTSTLQTAGAIVTVCNYDQGKQTLPNRQDIPYTLTARLVRYDSGTDSYIPVDASYISSNSLSAYTVTISESGGSSVTLNSGGVLTYNFTGQELTRNVADSDSYTVSFSSAFSSETPANLYLEMVVTPAEGTNLPTLCGILKVGLKEAGISDSWSGSFSDSTSNSPAEYDGYNYVIEGTGSGTFSITWDSTKVSLSDVSLRELLNIPSATRSGDTITFPVDSNDTSRYEIQFYKVNITTETWSNMNSSVVTNTFTS